MKTAPAAALDRRGCAVRELSGRWAPSWRAPNILPCHRVVARADLRGYGPGLARKRRGRDLEDAGPGR